MRVTGQVGPYRGAVTTETLCYLVGNRAEVMADHPLVARAL